MRLSLFLPLPEGEGIRRGVATDSPAIQQNEKRPSFPVWQLRPNAGRVHPLAPGDARGKAASTLAPRLDPRNEIALAHPGRDPRDRSRARDQNLRNLRGGDGSPLLAPGHRRPCGDRARRQIDRSDRIAPSSDGGPSSDLGPSSGAGPSWDGDPSSDDGPSLSDRPSCDDAPSSGHDLPRRSGRLARSDRAQTPRAAAGRRESRGRASAAARPCRRTVAESRRDLREDRTSRNGVRMFPGDDCRAESIPDRRAPGMADPGSRFRVRP